MLPAKGGVLVASSLGKQPDIALLDLSNGTTLGGIKLEPSAISTLHVVDGGHRIAVNTFKKKAMLFTNPEH